MSTTTAEAAQDELWQELTPPPERSDINRVLFDAIVEPILQRLYLSAQVSALESVAKELCPRYCDGERWHAARRRDGGGWLHTNRMDEFITRYCQCPSVHDALARLRAGSEPGAGSRGEEG